MAYHSDLLHWIKEREAIRERKAMGGPPPWTDDKILETYRFCNVYREDDKVTRWIDKNWRGPHKKESSVAFAMCVARMVNWPDTLAELGYPHPWSVNRFKQVLSRRREAGEKVWTGAYMVTGGYSEGGEPKEVIIARVLNRAKVFADKIKKGDTLAEAAAHLLNTPGMGTFLVAQVIADVKYTPLLADAEDWFTWCAPGPGSTMGLNILQDRDLRQYVGEEQFREEVNVVRKYIKDYTGYELCAQDAQNCLCEFSKYVRAKRLGQSLKTRYTPAEDPEVAVPVRPPEPAAAKPEAA